MDRHRQSGRAVVVRTSCNADRPMQAGMGAAGSETLGSQVTVEAVWLIEDHRRANQRPCLQVVGFSSEARLRGNDRVPSSRVLQETCTYIRSLHREVDDLSERLSELLATSDMSSAQAAIIRSLLM
ncbi:hypothetical protein ZWY2020_007056 [Hordeum vulgare]|nr:hypothetical protein ZWY2020_007056 [Hordeum vulgare]